MISRRADSGADHWQKNSLQAAGGHTPLFEVALVVLLSRIKWCGSRNFCNNGPLKFPGGLQAGLGLFGYLPLAAIVEKNG